MAVLVDKKTKILVQGITGTQASFHIPRAMAYGTNIVAGVVPHKVDKTYLGVPVFETVEEAKNKTGAEASLIFVPAKYAKSAILEAIHEQLRVVVVITSGIPVSDMMEIKHELQNSSTILIGPNTPGVITPMEAYMGMLGITEYDPATSFLAMVAGPEQIVSITPADETSGTVTYSSDTDMDGTGDTEFSLTYSNLTETTVDITMADVYSGQEATYNCRAADEPVKVYTYADASM